MPKPQIGRVHGDAYGGAIGLLAICDTVLAVEGARFALTETRLVQIPATIGPNVIARLGEGPARRVFMSARELDADEAKDLGLVSKTVPAAELDAAIEAEVVPYLLVAAGAVGRAKALARMLGPVIDEAVIEATIERLAEAWDSEEAKEGIAAFLEKRPPSWAP
jgi:methylglutaconyl-CoA hydratase